MPSKNLNRRNPLTLRSAEPVGLASERGGAQLALADIRTDGGTQMRAGLNEETVREYLDAIVNAHPEGSRPGTHWPFPAVVVFHDGEAYWMGDGFHRVEAARRYVAEEKVGLTIPADVRAGARREAILYAAGANATHGLRRTNADKRRAVEALLRDEEWGKWSDREIARRCQVDHKTVAAVRSELSGEFPQIDPISLAGEKPQIEERNALSGEIPQIERTVQRGDSVYTMNITGQRAQGAPASRMRAPKGQSSSVTPASAPKGFPPLGAALTLDETIALVWAVIRVLVQSSDPIDRLAWLASLPDDKGFYRDTPADRSLAPETLQAAKTHVVEELQGQLVQREGKLRRSAAKDLPRSEGQSAPVGLEQANGALEQDQGGSWLPAELSGRPRLPRSLRVNQLLSLYQEVLATLDEYGRLIADSSGTKYVEDVQQAITAMIAELEKEVGMAG